MLSYYALTPGEATYSASPVLQLLNTVVPADIATEASYSIFLEEIRRECSQYGDIVSILIPRPDAVGGLSKDDPAKEITSLPSCGVGKVFVEYRLAEECRKAISGLAGRTFNKRTVLASYYTPVKYPKGIF
jgi:splicing factor U2AF subunit